MPASARKQYFALRAFNAELASIKDGSERRRSRPTDDAGASIGLRMRMQWWREALDELYPNDEPRSSREPSVEGFLSSVSSSYWHNPVVRALNYAVQESQLTRRFLERLLDAREADLDIKQLPTLDNAIMYAEDSCSSLLYLSLECCDVREDAADEVASNIGVAWGLVTAIRATAYRALNEEMSIPAELFTKSVPADYIAARLDPDYTPNPEMEKQLKEAIQHVAYTATRYVDRATSAQSDVPKQGRAAMLPVVPVILFLTLLQQANYDIFDPKLHPDRSRLVLLAMLARTWLTGRF
jgi:phytoene/squalene synthetase